MQLLTEVFYIFSNALLIPVLVVLLVSVVRTLIQSGRVLQEYLTRLQQKDSTATLEQALVQDSAILPIQEQRCEVQRIVFQMLAAANDLAQIAYLAERAELGWRRQLESLRGLVKLGPGLGLMGTLIPLGPALVGLAVGDIQTMSNNLVIAFSTTVLGLFVGLVAGYLVSVKKHWFQVDSALLNLCVDRISLRAAAGRPLIMEEMESTSQLEVLQAASDEIAQQADVEEISHV
ncbi:MotA/TolQ/ExbB proton channel family protein [Aureliella helgolandensis]|uniref:MotA/TolQ/ExbB proton channel domain-containing protein n=1 Tax=Aureliella helgolandensis TaxID=2527968 RepID=A0A518G3N2_9BACT|nr:MotA/TolQ/ExbB proton channel family protein [Aureliella helgolandensis]QDV23206.1 hypothetical protein Q31a_15040 [Aureliella helgolandensis]